MGTRVLALTSGSTQLEDHRAGLSVFMQQAGLLNARSGIIPTPGAGDLATVSAMVASVAPFVAWVDGTANGQQYGYPVVHDAVENFAFADGEASVDRVDRLWMVVYHNTYDTSGQTIGKVEYAKGQASGLAQPLPASAFLLWEQTIIHGTTAGTGGTNFANAVDKRPYTVAAGGAIPVASSTERAAIASPYNGMAIYRKDWGWVEIWDGAAWRVRSQGSVSTFTALATAISDPYEGLTIYVRDVDLPYTYTGTAWVTTRDTAVEITQYTNGTQAINSTEADVTGTSITFTTTKPNAKLSVRGVFDFSTGTGSSTGSILGKCSIDGTVQPNFATSELPGTAGRGSVTQNWNVTLAAAGSHTIKLRAIQTTGQAVNSNTNTSITYTLRD